MRKRNNRPPLPSPGGGYSLLDSRNPADHHPVTLNQTLKTMKKLLLILAATLTSLVLPGCFQSETTIHLNKDGSGTIVEETLLGTQMLEMIDQMAGLGGQDNKKDPLKTMFSEEKAKTRATELGEGVTFEKCKIIDANGAKGARVTYTFKDINKLTPSFGDNMKKMSPMGEAHAGAAKKPKPVAFAYAGGKLTIKMPQPDPKDAPEIPAAEVPDKPDMNNPEAEAMMKQMLGDMKMSLKVVIEPGVAETNASHQNGNTITLFDMNMGKLLENADTLKKLGKIDKNNPAAAMEALKGIEGLKCETQQEVTVKVN